MWPELKQNVSQINWKIAVIIGTFIVGLLVYDRALGVLALIGIPPLLIILACVLPCLAPIIYLRRK